MMKSLLIASTIIELGAGLGLLCFPALAVTLLTGESIGPPATLDRRPTRWRGVVRVGCRLRDPALRQRTSRSSLCYYSDVVLQHLSGVRPRLRGTCSRTARTGAVGGGRSTLGHDDLLREAISNRH